MENTIEVLGKKIFFRQYGSGPAVVLLHGIPTHSLLWENMIPYFNSYTVYAFDLLGYGNSEKLSYNEIDIKSQAKYLNEALKILNINKAIIIGHDIGGGIAKLMTISNMAFFKALILIDSVCYDSWPINILKGENNIRMLYNNLPHEVLYDVFLKYIRNGLYNKEKAEAIANKYWNNIEQNGNIEGFINLIRSYDYYSTKEITNSLKYISIPTLILWGKHDEYIKPSNAYRLSEDIKNSKVEILERCSHFMPEDCPREASKIILDYIESI